MGISAWIFQALKLKEQKIIYELIVYLIIKHLITRKFLLLQAKGGYKLDF